MNKLRMASTLLAMALFLPATVTASEYYPAFLVLRYFVDGSEQERERLKDAHQKYYLSQGREGASFRILDDQGQRIGRGSWMAFKSKDDAREFIENDPYQRAKLYRETAIEKANIYFLDEWFSIAPSWRNDANLEEAHDRYDREISPELVPPV